jgi:hypothetical protein
MLHEKQQSFHFCAVVQYVIVVGLCFKWYTLVYFLSSAWFRLSPVRSSYLMAPPASRSFYIASSTGVIFNSCSSILFNASPIV